MPGHHCWQAQEPSIALPDGGGILVLYCPPGRRRGGEADGKLHIYGGETYMGAGLPAVPRTGIETHVAGTDVTRVPSDRLC